MNANLGVRSVSGAASGANPYRRLPVKGVSMGLTHSARRNIPHL